MHHFCTPPSDHRSARIIKKSRNIHQQENLVLNPSEEEALNPKP